MFICNFCKKQYIPKTIRKDRQNKFCSLYCLGKATGFKKGKRGENKILKQCNFCGDNFRTYSLLKKFCSNGCRNSSYTGLPVNFSIRYDKTLFFKKTCKKCCGIKSRLSEYCFKCMVKEKTGEKSPYYKGGYECKIKNNRERTNRLKIIGFHTEKQWEELKFRHNFMCLCCKKREPFIKLTRDHILPISKGGDDKITNIQPLCKSCNSIKYVNIISYLELSEPIKTGANL